jgi:hypothetical protein
MAQIDVPRITVIEDPQQPRPARITVIEDPQ